MHVLIFMPVGRMNSNVIIKNQQGGKSLAKIIERYNIFSTQMLVRCDVVGKLYLYDFVRTKKKRANCLSNKTVR